MNFAEILQLLQVVLPPLINVAEAIFGPKSGAQKLPAVMGAANSFLGMVGADPITAESLAPVVEQHLSAMKANGTLVPKA